jgi:hypothetical protein
LQRAGIEKDLLVVAHGHTRRFSGAAPARFHGMREAAIDRERRPEVVFGRCG